MPLPVRSTSVSRPRRRCRAGLPLVIALTGFTDAGQRRLPHDRLLPRRSRARRRSSSFSNDVLLDYRARRPIISFEQDHLTDYRPPRLELSLAHDSLGQPFVLLAGYEPDFAWDAFAETVARLRRAACDVSLGHVGARDPHARAAHAADRHHGQRHPQRPHRRRTRCGSRTRRCPATAGHLLEYRFARGRRAGRRVRAARSALPGRHRVSRPPRSRRLDSLTVATGLVFAGDDAARREPRVPREGRRSRSRAATSSPRMVHSLEERYDAYMAGSTLGAADHPHRRSAERRRARRRAGALPRDPADRRRRQARSLTWHGMPAPARRVVADIDALRTSDVRASVRQ